MSEFKIGDILKIREWDDMAEEYGINRHGNIACDLVFIRGMKYMCGEIFTLRKIDAGGRYHSQEGIEKGYSISKDMLEYAHISDVSLDIDPGDEAVLTEYLSQFI